MAPLHTQGVWGGGVSREGICFQCNPTISLVLGSFSPPAVRGGGGGGGGGGAGGQEG